MSNTSALVITYGFFGDIAFASGLAEELKQQYDEVNYVIGFPQMKSLLENNPNIDNVYVPASPGPAPRPSDELVLRSTKVIQLHSLSFEEPPVTEYKRKNNFIDLSPSYKLYTNPEYDKVVQGLMKDLDPNKKTICTMANWEERSFLFTEEQYKAGVDVPNLGYGGSWRATAWIVNQLSEHFNILQLGVHNGTPQYKTVSIGDDSPKSILFETSIMKYCDAFVGAEGGLCNLAAGVGTKTIITGDFIHQLYGWNGVLRQIKEPKLGPKYYFEDAGHITLDPYLTDKEVVEQIINNV